MRSIRLAFCGPLRLHGLVPPRRSIRVRVSERFASRQRRQLANRLLAAGLIDSSFLGAQLDADFLSDAEAAAAWASTEPRLQYAPHPLIEPAWIDDGRWSSGRGARRSSVGPQLALPGMRAWVEEAAEIVAALTPESVLPSAPGVRPVTLQKAVAVATERAREFARQDRHSLRRHATAWTADDEVSASSVETKSFRRVSIVMPVRDRAGVVSAAIDSVRAQAFTNWELLVVDDGSTDDTPSIVRSYVDTDPRVRLLQQEATGVSAARNRGLAEATGDLIAFLDSDNTWTQEHLRAAVSAVEDGAGHVVHTVVRIRRGDGSVEFAAEQVDRQALLEGRNAIDLNALVVTREAIQMVGGFDETLRRWVDYDLILRLAQHFELSLVPVVGVNYDHRHDAADRITTRESPLWRRVVLERALVDWNALEQGCSAREAGISVVIRSRGQWPRTLSTVLHLRTLVDVVDVVVVDAASARAESGILSLATAADPAVTILRTPWDAGWSLSVELALTVAKAEHVVAVSPGARPTAPDLATVTERARQLGKTVLTPYGKNGILLAAELRSLIDARGLDLIEDPLLVLE